MNIPTDATEDYMREIVLKQPRLAPYLEGKQVMRTIIVPRKLVNIVVK